MRNQSKGFSLLELLLVVSVIMILAAIAIPKYVVVRQRATATAAVSNVRSLNNALAAYASRCDTIGYPATLAPLAGSANNCTAANLVDASLVTNPVQRYNFTYTVGPGTPANSYTLLADPTSLGSSFRHYFTDDSNVIRFNDSGPSSVSDPAIS